MNSTTKDTINFCLQFIRINSDNVSQKTQCRTWTKMAIETMAKEDIGSRDFIISELEAIDRYLSGADGKMTTVDVMNKVETISQLMGD